MPYSASSEARRRTVSSRTISRADFEWLRSTVSTASGIDLAADRTRIILTRLGKRLRATGATSFAEYAARVRQDGTGAELWMMIDSLTVNRTSFFREPDQYPTYIEALRELLQRHSVTTVWSAGCASGEETFTLAMLAESVLPRATGRIRFLGTDISTTVLHDARAGIYAQAQTAELPMPLQPLLEPVADRTGRVRVVPRVRERVAFARHNLVGTWRMRGPMHVIFCQNVLIYFDREAQARVIAAMREILVPGGWLFLGSSESIDPDMGLYCIQPGVYRKRPGSA